MDSKIFLGKYRVDADEIESVGEPADSVRTYEAEEIGSEKKVVVEVVPAAALKAPARERLEAEAMAAKTLNHVNIVPLYDFGVQDDHLVYVTEDFEGTPAEEWVNRNGPMPVGPVLRIASQVVSAMGAAAFHRIIHRALNPANLVLVPGQTSQGEWPLVKVLHFVGGAPKIPGSDVAVAEFDKSTHYASPEQLQRGAVDFRSEIYSLGCTMWFLLTGTPPLRTPNGAMTTPPLKAGVAAEKGIALPKKVGDMLAEMLSTNPEGRPRDPLAFYRKLQDCLAQAEGREPAVRAARASAPRLDAIGAPRSRRSPLKSLVRLAICLTMAAVAALVWREYLKHSRIVRAEEPIGVPIGVTNASSSGTPARPTLAAIAPLPTPVADADARTVTAENSKPNQANITPPATNAVESVSTRQITTASVLTTSDPPASPPSRETTSVITNSVSAPPAVIGSSEVAAAAQVQIASTPAKPRETEAAADVLSPPKKIKMREVRRAEPADEPEVRRAEPVPEDEPANVESERVTPAETVSRPVKRKALEPRVTPTPVAIPIEQPTPKRRPNDAIYLPRPVR